MPTVTAKRSKLTIDIGEADALRKAGDLYHAIEIYEAAAATAEAPPSELCLKLARCYRSLKNWDKVHQWVVAVTTATDDFIHWQAASSLLQTIPVDAQPQLARSARLALLSSYTTTQFAPMLQLAGRSAGIALEIYECHYGQYRQEIVDENSDLYKFRPDVVVLAVHEGDLGFQEYSQSPSDDVQAELGRWVSLWQKLAKHASTRVIQHNFVVPSVSAWGHLGSSLRGSRQRMIQELNAHLGDHAQGNVSIVDCDRLSSLIGKQRWTDPRYWNLAKQAVALDVLPMLAKHTMAVAAAQFGLSRKCLVLDLDNTLWGGVIGEDGLAGIRLQQGVDGEAFVQFQEYVLDLKKKGVILAVCSKNNEEDAKLPFTQHPGMRLKLSDIAVFVANWQSKPENLRSISQRLNIGLDALVFVDDNPAERQAVRQALPEVDVVTLPDNPSYYARALSDYLLFESASYTAEDTQRTEQYQARARVAEAAESAESLEDLHRSLRMQAVISPFDEFQLPRVAQLIGKTNQFNLTTRRHTQAQLAAMMTDPQCVHVALRLRDCFADHGLVSVAIAYVRDGVLDLDTWLMSCRVIGRTVEAQMLSYLCAAAADHGCVALRGTFIPTAKNAMVKDVFARFGFVQESQSGGTTTWRYDLTGREPITNEFIENMPGW